MSPEQRKKPYVVNVGLPRTGTTSFTKASQILGLSSLHVWLEAEYDTDVCNDIRNFGKYSQRFLSQYATLSDTPFFILRKTFEKHYPGTRLIFTTRCKASWIKSMISHGTAGGQFLRDIYDVPSGDYTSEHTPYLSTIYDRHHQAECAGLPEIHLTEMSDDDKWRVLCEALPDSDRYMSICRGLPWPHQNKSRK
ncbi:MAG: sulfotransferase [Pseudomonadota bacterium]